MGEQQISEEVLHEKLNYLELPLKKTIEYLVDHGILRNLGPIDSRIHSIVIVSKDTVQGKALQNALNNRGLPGSKVLSIDNLESHNFEHPDTRQLWILLLEQYSEIRVRQFYRILSKRPDNMGIVAYFHLGSFNLSSLYSARFGTPCQLCQMAWEDQGKSPVTSESGSITGLLRLFENEGIFDLPPPALQDLDWSVSVAYTANLISRLCGTSMKKLLQDQITIARNLDLTTFQLSSTPAAHWPGCDCQYGFKEED